MGTGFGVHYRSRILPEPNRSPVRTDLPVTFLADAPSTILAPRFGLDEVHRGRIDRSPLA